MPELEKVFGLNTDLETILMFAIRAVVVFGLSVIFVRIGGKRLFNKNSAFDIVAAIMLGSILSRAITDSSPFIPTLVAAAMLVFTHRFFAYLSYRTNWLGKLIKGRKTVLIKDGKLLEENMRRAHITRRDLLLAAREQAKINKLEDIQEANLERSGNISILPKENRSQNG